MSDRRLAQPSPRRARTLLALVAGFVAAGVAFALPAAAHVTVNPREATQGEFAKLAFRVPNESDTAGTVALKVTMPTDAPLASVSVRPVPGWDVEVITADLPTPVEVHGTTITEAVSTITWTAQDGVRIEPGQFQEFEISAGPMPEVGSLALPAEQTYDDGTVVSWSDPVTGDGTVPEHPAPTLTLVPAGGGDDDGPTDPTTTPAPTSAPIDTPPVETTTETPTPTPTTTTAPADTVTGSDPTARLLGAAALGVGLGALVVSIITLQRIPRRQEP